MMSFVDLISVIESDVSVSALAELRRHVRDHAWQSFASALESQRHRQVPSMTSGAIDGAFQLRMIALLERAQNANREGRTAVTMSPALRAALDRYVRFKAIEGGRKVNERKSPIRPVDRPLSGENSIVRWGREFGKQACDWLKSWLARMRGRGR